MATIYWRHAEPATDRSQSEGEVNEKNPFPIELFVRPDDSLEPERVEAGHPLPVSIIQDVQSRNIKVTPGLAPVVVSTSTVTLIVPANPNRRSVLLTNVTGTQICYLHVSNAVSATNYAAILTGAVGSNATFYTKEAIYGLSASSAQTIGIWEEGYVNG